MGYVRWDRICYSDGSSRNDKNEVAAESGNRRVALTLILQNNQLPVVLEFREKRDPKPLGSLDVFWHNNIRAAVAVRDTHTI